MRADFVLAVFLTSHVIAGVLSSEWGYAGDHGPSHWSTDNAICSHDSQSPIDIITGNTLPDPDLSLLTFDGYGQDLSGGIFQNNGHSVQLNFPSGKTFTLSGGGMGTNTYTALQLHFHWAAPGSLDGSEHTVDGKHYPVEMHVVHIKDPFKSTEEVRNMPDGLTVLGVFLSVGDGPDNVAYQKLFDAVKNCTFEGDQTTLTDGPPLISLLPPLESYFRYSGSLTTPPCFEAVTWTVFREPVAISRAQLEILQSLQSGCKDPDCDEKHKRSVEEDEDDEDEDENDEEDGANTLGGNFRPTQPLNGRIVTSFLDIALRETKDEGHWFYYGHASHGGSSEWSKDYPTCGQDKQSPINVEADQTKALGEKYDDTEKLKPLSFSGYDDALSGEFTNNGHSVQLNFAKDLQYAVSEGGLDESYAALQLHFHWGEVASDGSLSDGSEHTLNGRRYPAEMHIVHAKTSYMPSLSDFQQNSSDAYTVLGVFVDVDQEKKDDETDNDQGENPSMQKLFEAIEKVKYSGETTDFSSGPSLASLLPESKSFYRYDGSLTTPPCSEAVIWTLFTDPITVSVNQFIAFQQLFSVDEDTVFERNSIKLVSATMHIESKISTEKDKDAKSEPETEANSTMGHEAEDTNMHLRSALHPTADSVGENNEIGDYLLRNNYRPLQEVNGRTVYYYESSGPDGEPTSSSGLPVLEIVLCTVGGIIIFIAMIAIGMRCCCKKEKKGKQYTAAKRADEEIIDM